MYEWLINIRNNYGLRRKLIGKKIGLNNSNRYC